MPRHFTQSDKQEIQERLITVGLELFESKGINDTHISDITREVNIGQGTFYKFYKSKGDLFMDIYQIERGKVINSLYEKYYMKKEEPRVLLRSFIDDYQNFLRPILRIIYEPDALRLITERTVKERLNDYNIRSNSEISEIIQSWFDIHHITVLKAEIITAMIRSLNFLYFHIQAIGNEVFKDVIEGFSEAIIALVDSSNEN